MIKLQMLASLIVTSAQLVKLDYNSSTNEERNDLIDYLHNSLPEQEFRQLLELLNKVESKNIVLQN